jgi:putative membrane protein
MRRRVRSALGSGIALIVVAELGIGVAAHSVGALVAAALVLAALNLFVRPLVTLLTLPLNMLTLGVFSWVVSGLLLWAVAAVVPGFEVRGFLGALEGSLLIGLVSGVLGWIFR